MNLEKLLNFKYKIMDYLQIPIWVYQEKEIETFYRRMKIEIEQESDSDDEIDAIVRRSSRSDKINELPQPKKVIMRVPKVKLEGCIFHDTYLPGHSTYGMASVILCKKSLEIPFCAYTSEQLEKKLREWGLIDFVNK